MCSRYFLDADGNVIAYTFSVPVHDRIRKRFNIAPTQEAPVVRVDESGERAVAMLRWGLVPAWAKEAGAGLINARAETVDEKPSFRQTLFTPSRPNLIISLTRGFENRRRRLLSRFCYP